MYDDNWPPNYDSTRLTIDNTQIDSPYPYNMAPEANECVNYVSDEEWGEVYE